MSTFHPATLSLANFKNTISTISMTQFFVYISCSHQNKNIRLSWHPARTLFTCQLHSHICCKVPRATNKGIAVLKVWSIFPSLLSTYWVLSTYFLAVFKINMHALINPCVQYVYSRISASSEWAT